MSFFKLQLKIYQEVIEDVINGVREYFLAEQVDEATLQELKQTWESKLRASKAVDGRHNEDKQGEFFEHNQAPYQLNIQNIAIK